MYKKHARQRIHDAINTDLKDFFAISFACAVGGYTILDSYDLVVNTNVQSVLYATDTSIKSGICTAIYSCVGKILMSRGAKFIDRKLDPDLMASKYGVCFAAFMGAMLPVYDGVSTFSARAEALREQIDLNQKIIAEGGLATNVSYPQYSGPSVFPK